ncbi:MAG TPA: ATP-grasp domain-containing protein [Jatrophihabitans sp.]|jgi:biotin carboxylase|uniref:ATP-grasp domain-containing protein n=1 Tax=Jatrophihabitans sp. TaxID=1932789 RepID=UPI002EE46235
MPEQRRPVAVVVDLYTCSHFLLDAFTALGIDVVQVKSDPELPAFGAEMAYLATVSGDDPAELADQLVPYSPIAVVAGQETDVLLADALSERLGLPSNGTALSSARRDKFDMAEALRRAGVRCADQFKSGSAEDVVAWAEAAGRYPVVVKPLASAATDKVAICADAAQVREAAETILGAQTIWGEVNHEVLVQSYLDGIEYVVDMVSWQGRRYTCGVWEYRKRQVGVHNIYDYEILLPAEDNRVGELVGYVDSALRALGIEYGPTHAEVIITPDGPALVEVGARTAGNLSPAFHDLCLGANQAGLTALAYARPQEFGDRYAGRCYTALCQAWVYNTPTDREGVVKHVDRDVVAEIEGLQTVSEVIVKLREGWRMRPTVDLLSSTLKVFLASDSTEALRRDYQRITEFKDRVYQLE